MYERMPTAAGFLSGKISGIRKPHFSRFAAESTGSSRFDGSADAIAFSQATGDIRLAQLSSAVAAMEKLRAELISSLDVLSSATDEDFREGYSRLVAQMESMFRHEEQCMEDLDFPASGIHQEQHARVLGALHNVHLHVMDGDLNEAYEVVTKLIPQWFPFHVLATDAALALALQMAQPDMYGFGMQP
jgi:hemerythrin